jgi:hypothetical protein
MVKTPPPTGLSALARAAARTSSSKSTATTGASSRSSGNRTDQLLADSDSDPDNDNNRRFDYDDNDDTVEEVAPPPLAEATLADVELVEMMDGEPMEPLKLVQKIIKDQPPQLTRIKAIAGNIITGIILGDLKTFAGNNNVMNAQGNSLRRGSKKEICDRIILYIEDPTAAATVLTKTKDIVEFVCCLGQRRRE